MVSWIVFIRLAKWAFFGFLTTGIGFMIKHVTVTRYEKEEVLPLRVSEELMQKYLWNKLDPDYVQCMQSPSKVFCAAVSREIHLMRTSKLYPTSNFTARSRRHPVYTAICDFLHVMTKFNIKVILVEPSTLYCMLAIGEKISLGLQGFSILRHLGVKNVINFVMFENNSAILESIPALSTLHSLGFRHWTIKTKTDEFTSNGNDMQTTHYFFEKRMIFVHVVVLFIYNRYFFHAGLATIFPEKRTFVANFQSSELFGTSDAVYESFQVSLLENNSIIPDGLYIPNSIYRFLLELEFASLIKCRKSNVSTTHSHVNLAEKINGDLITAFNIVLRDLKNHFEVLSAKFFIFDATYLDWYQLCGINPNAKLLTFALTTDDVKRIDEYIITKFKNNQELKLTYILGQVEEAREFRLEYHGIEIRLWYIYKIRDSVWIGKHDFLSNNYTRYTFARFDLCSVIIHNNIALAPCTLRQLPNGI